MLRTTFSPLLQLPRRTNQNKAASLAVTNKSNNSTKKPLLPSHRDAHKPSMSRRFALPRAGALEFNTILSSKNAKTTTEKRPFEQKNNACNDAFAPITGHLDYWRHTIMQPSADPMKSNMTVWKQVPPQWDVVVPLLEKIREAGRSDFWKKNEKARSVNGGQLASPAPSMFFEQQHHQKEFSVTTGGGNSENDDQNTLLPTGHRISREAIRKQMLVELNVRLPLLEQTMETTASPSLVARLCKTMLYCDIDVPKAETFSSSTTNTVKDEGTQTEQNSGLLNTKLRLRALLIASLRKIEIDLANRNEKIKDSNESELRKRRRLALEAVNSSALFDFLYENKETFQDCSDDQMKTILAASGGGQCDISVLNLDFEKELPNVLSWAKEGKEAVLSLNRKSDETDNKNSVDDEPFTTSDRLVGQIQNSQKPLQWLPQGTLATEEEADDVVEEEMFVKIEGKSSQKRSENSKKLMME